MDLGTAKEIVTNMKFVMLTAHAQINVLGLKATVYRATEMVQRKEIAKLGSSV